MAYADQMPGSKRVSTIAGVVVAHALIGYVFMSGLAVEMARSVTRTLTVENIAIAPPPPPEVAPPPEPMKQVVPRTAIERPVIVDPIVQTQQTEGPALVTVDIPQPAMPPMPLPQVSDPVGVPAHPAAGKSVGVKVKGDRASWITNDDYPSAALRSAEEGSVGISVRIGADGRVSSCEVIAPSGSSALDQVTCRLYARNARFSPARDDAGNAISSSYSDRVRWQLPAD